jgi:hypothetical protein
MLSTYELKRDRPSARCPSEANSDHGSEQSPWPDDHIADNDHGLFNIVGNNTVAYSDHGSATRSR